MKDTFEDRYLKSRGKLFFKYGTMGSSKSAQCIMTGYNYELQGKGVIYLKPELDTRDKEGCITSRAISSPKPCKTVSINENLFNMILTIMEDCDRDRIYAVIIDESQFLTERQVRQLSDLTKYFDITILCYGLKNSYIRGKLFEGSKALLYYADSIEEIKNVCQYCDRKATMNLLIENGKAKRSGEVIVIGDTDQQVESYYVPTCSYHYENPKIKNEGK